MALFVSEKDEKDTSTCRSVRWNWYAHKESLLLDLLDSLYQRSGRFHPSLIATFLDREPHTILLKLQAISGYNKYIRFLMV